MTKFWFDLETYSPVPIKHGAWAYAEKAEILLFAYAIDDGPAKIWDWTAKEPEPPELLAAARDPDIEWWGHNSAMFDWPVISFAMPWLFKIVAQERRRDTMIQAYAHSLPGSLDALCSILNLPQDQRKSKEGRGLIHLFCIPPKETEKRPRATGLTHPEQWGRFKDYAISDIISMRAAAKKMPTWNYPGNPDVMKYWHMDNRMNYRGMPIDMEVVHAAIKASDNAKKELAIDTRTMTDGAVESATQRDSMLAHVLAQYGVLLPDMRASTLERRIGDPNLPQALRELLAVRLQASTTSVSKYTALARGVNKDGRLRGTHQFNGAARTGRWAGRLFQPQNLPSRGLLPQVEIDRGIEALKADCAELFFDNIMHLTSSAIRGAVAAPKGNKFVVADLANIEGRMLAWLAGEKWKLQAFRDFDAGVGQDLYILAYSKAFGVDPKNVTKDMRQIGKVMELAFGYQGGVGAWVTFAAAYNVDLEKMAEEAWPTLDPVLRMEATEFLEWTRDQKRPTFGLSDRAFITCDVFKRAWRNAHPATVAFWKALENGVYDVMMGLSATAHVNHLTIDRKKAWLRIRLPSGRYLCYPQPTIEKEKFSYMGINQYSRQWERISTYGGKLAENLTQAASCDILCHGMLLAEDNGYPPEMTVHDEDVTEVPDTEEYNAKTLGGFLATTPSWAPGLPLAAEGFESMRYRK